MQLERKNRALRGGIISIHAPYKGCNMKKKKPRWTEDISIHAPYKGCNSHDEFERLRRGKFQSMHPIKDATKTPSFLKRSSFYFNPCTL